MCHHYCVGRLMGRGYSCKSLYMFLGWRSRLPKRRERARRMLMMSTSSSMMRECRTGGKLEHSNKIRDPAMHIHFDQGG